MWGSLLAGGLSLLSGFGAQQSAKKQAKQQAANDYIANATNARNVGRTNAINTKLGQKLGKALVNSKQTVTEHTQGSVTLNRESGSDSGSDTDNYSYVDTAAMMAAADAAGFNPVTFLNAGGMQAYTQTGSRTRGWERSFDNQTEITDLMVTTKSKGHNAAAGYQLMAGLMSPQTFQMQSSQAVKIPSMLETIGDAGTAALNQYNNDARHQSNQDFQREMLGKQLDAIQKNSGRNNNPSRSFYSPTTTTSGGKTVTSAGGALGSGPSISGPFERGIGKATNPWGPGPMGIDTKWSDAETFSDRYGDIAEEVAGAWNLANDSTKSAVGRNIPSIIREEWKGLPAASASEKDWLQRNFGLSDTRSGFQRMFGELEPVRKWLFD